MKKETLPINSIRNIMLLNAIKLGSLQIYLIRIHICSCSWRFCLDFGKEQQENDSWNQWLAMKNKNEPQSTRITTESKQQKVSEQVSEQEREIVRQMTDRQTTRDRDERQMRNRNDRGWVMIRNEMKTTISNSVSRERERWRTKGNNNDNRGVRADSQREREEREREFSTYLCSDRLSMCCCVEWLHCFASCRPQVGALLQN